MSVCVCSFCNKWHKIYGSFRTSLQRLRFFILVRLQFTFATTTRKIIYILVQCTVYTVQYSTAQMYYVYTNVVVVAIFSIWLQLIEQHFLVSQATESCVRRQFLFVTAKVLKIYIWIKGAVTNKAHRIISLNITCVFKMNWDECIRIEFDIHFKADKINMLFSPALKFSRKDFPFW